MFVRWQSRKRRRPQFGIGRKSDIHWAAILVEAVRIKGRPTQRHVAYLGGITESAIEIIHQRGWFWAGVFEILDRLGNRISPPDRRLIEASIGKRVRCPTKAQFEDTVANAAALWSDLVDQRRVLNKYRPMIDRWPKGKRK